MTTSKSTPANKAKQPSAKSDTQSADDNIAKVTFDRAKDALPDKDAVVNAASDMSDYIQDQTNVDLHKMANDAARFVQRNPGTSLAAAVGVGAVIGILLTKRS